MLYESLGGWNNGSTKFRLAALWYFSLQEKWRARADEIEDAIYVTMEILSNWGNASWVGLTEVQFFDLNDIKLYVSPHDVDIRNAVLPGKLGCLVNRDLVVSEGAWAWCVFSVHSEHAVSGWGSMLSSTLVILCSQVRRCLWGWYPLCDH